jgi:hypothetical protein
VHKVSQSLPTNPFRCPMVKPLDSKLFLQIDKENKHFEVEIHHRNALNIVGIHRANAINKSLIPWLVYKLNDYMLGLHM